MTGLGEVLYMRDMAVAGPVSAWAMARTEAEQCQYVFTNVNRYSGADWGRVGGLVYVWPRNFLLRTHLLYNLLYIPTSPPSIM